MERNTKERAVAWIGFNQKQNRSVDMTNADKIRSMTDEELSEFLVKFKNTFGDEYEGEQSCLRWLQSNEVTTAENFDVRR